MGPTARASSPTLSANNVAAAHAARSLGHLDLDLRARLAAGMGDIALERGASRFQTVEVERGNEIGVVGASGGGYFAHRVTPQTGQFLRHRHVHAKVVPVERDLVLGASIRYDHARMHIRRLLTVSTGMTVETPSFRHRRR